MRLALYQPDIPQNVGSLVRLSACMNVPLDIIGPCGFAFDVRQLKKVALDYYEHAALSRHSSWKAFGVWRRAQARPSRLVLFTTKSTMPYTDFAFAQGDILLFGQESSGVPPEVAAEADARLRIPIAAITRSLNVAQAAAMGLSEAVRQTKGLAHG